jgi:signal transduction histidine kinase
LFLFFGAIAIGAFTLWYTQNLVQQLKQQEHERMGLWAEAMRELTVSDNDPNIPRVVYEVIINNNTIPVILVDATDTIIYHRNLRLPGTNENAFMQSKINKMRADSAFFEIDLGDGEKQYLYYGDSILIQRLSWFPVVQLMVVSIFILVAYLAFSGARKAEQDQVWVGLAKETAHQLGTPTSSLLGWIDVLKLKIMEPQLVNEMTNDVARLQTITDRFSKIGSKPELIESDLGKVIRGAIDYLGQRVSKKVEFQLDLPADGNLLAKINPVLLEWVVENVCKNAVDAANGEGIIAVKLQRVKNTFVLDLKDSGKGLHKHQFKTIFEPGYTTKKRGWGLGLSLAKRIIEQYHGGKIFVKDSEVGQGTTIRIILPAS